MLSFNGCKPFYREENFDLDSYMAVVHFLFVTRKAGKVKKVLASLRSISELLPSLFGDESMGEVFAPQS